jgi:hypothetical protein
MPTEVEFISASWCKRCGELRPEVERRCQLTGAAMTYVDFDEIDETDERKDIVKSLPTIRMRSDGGTWTIWTAATFNAWVDAITATSAFTGVEDF